jgi:phosphatidylserine/phosphatidylglycerophosphate/cardiolipin synthase-like enzyme
MTTDLTFLTNEHGKRLKDRFEVLIKDTRFFDCLVGYFYTSGFFKIYKALEKPEKIRILIGISTDRHTFDLIEEAKDPRQIELKFSHAEVKQEYENVLEKEFEESADNKNIEDGVEKFIEWLRSKKLEIRAYPSDKIHAKVYIMTFSETDRDKGRVITGSSNFTQAGLEENLEFNVELKNRSDYDFALNKFNELWGDSVDVSEKYIETIRTKTWLNQTVSPYQLYLKFLYEYFKDELNQPDELAIRYLP